MDRFELRKIATDALIKMAFDLDYYLILGVVILLPKNYMNEEFIKYIIVFLI